MLYSLFGHKFVLFYANLDPGQWIPPVRARPIEEGAIAVKIGHSPPELNLTQFKVMLVKRSSDEYSAFRTTFYTEPVSLLVKILKSRKTRFTGSKSIVYIFVNFQISEAKGLPCA